jgi:hypothetical protein
MLMKSNDHSNETFFSLYPSVEYGLLSCIVTMTKGISSAIQAYIMLNIAYKIMD